jgi:hypothetical protein
MITERRLPLCGLRWRRAAARLGVVLVMLLLPAWGSGAQQPAGPWDIQQEPVVQVDVQVRDAADVALLASLGHACEVGACRLELPDGQEQNLAARGLAVQVVARAIKVSGRAQAAMATSYEYEGNFGDVAIPDAPASGCGAEVSSPLVITTAPAGATVAFIGSYLRVAHSYVSDLKVRMANGQHSFTVWNRYGGATDEGVDDDSEDDDDIELGYPDWEVHNFDGDPVNQTWRLYAQDCLRGFTGNIDFWRAYIYYECAPLTPHTPAGPAPADGSTGQGLNVDLDWAPADHATSYAVYFGAYAPPPKVGDTTNSLYVLPGLTCNTHYYWRIVAKNNCAETYGPIWDFTTVCCPPAGAPANPSPADGATGVALDADVDWSDVAGATSYDVYGGISPSPPYIGTTAVSNFAAPTLACGTRHYWKIVAKNACGSVAGAVWDFTTVCCPLGAPASPAPADGATGVALSADLDWADVAGATAYDVYFGTNAAPPRFGVASASRMALPALSGNTRYYWKVVAQDGCGQCVGPVWYFETQAGAFIRTIRLPLLPR